MERKISLIKLLRMSDYEANTQFRPEDMERVHGEELRRVAIDNHRKLWYWLCRDTIKKRKKVEKYKFFNHLKLSNVSHQCYLCEYRRRTGILCSECLLDWKKESCTKQRAYYEKWRTTDEKNWIKSAYYAWKIARLKERERDY